MQELCDAVAAAPRRRRPAKQAYHEVWLNGEKLDDPDEPTSEPIYGTAYLPRKFKVGFALPDDNCTDILAQCLGFLAITENGKPVGLQPVRRRRAGADEQQARHLPAARPAGRLHRPVGSGGGGGGRAAAVPRPRQPGRTASGPGSST